MINRYIDIKCPKCGKAHFRVKQHNTDFGYDIFPAVFIRTEDPIYKDGVLQNPPKPKPAIERFQCIECGCNFRTETYPASGDVAVVPNIINEDEEEGFFKKIFREHNEEVAKQKETQEEVEKVAKITGVKKDGTKVEDITGTTNLEIGQGILTYTSTEPTVNYNVLDEKSIPGYEEIKLKVDDMWNRLFKIEEKLNDK